MIEKLKQLEETVLALRKQYHVVATELANLKAKPIQDPVLQANFDELQRAYALLEKQNQELGANHAAVCRELEQLKEQNQQLLNKNQLASRHAQTVLERLTQIDKQIQR